MEELKPCPFCGNSVAVGVFDENEMDYDSVSENPFFTVCCSVHEHTCQTPNWKTGCGAASGYARTKEQAIKKWNRRSCECANNAAMTPGAAASGR
jgi:hypothetical protein